jgi:hypothetical protein
VLTLCFCAVAKDQVVTIKEVPCLPCRLLCRHRQRRLHKPDGLKELSTIAFAGHARKELYGKSIAVSWIETRAMRFESEQQVRNTGTYVRTNVYISMSGRPFVQVARKPGEAGCDRVHEGQSILVYQEFRSGARGISIDLDGMACKATIVNGRELQELRYSVRDRARHRRSIVGASWIRNCSIREGNVFGQ